MMPMRAQLHEKLYLLFGVMICGALGLSAMQQMPTVWAIINLAACFAILMLMLLYVALLRWTEPGSVTRVLAAYAATWCLYAGSTSFVACMEMTTHEQALISADRFLLGLTPAECFHGKLSLWQLEVLSLGYVSYHVYLHWALLDSLFRNDRWRLAMSERLFLAFGLGFVGYFLFPSAPPDMASSLNQGGILTRLNESINASLAARYDAFPSLHALITATLLAWDWRHHRRRFFIMLVPSLIMLAATLALRLHYAVDLLASAALFAMLSLFHAHRNRHNCQPMGA